MLCIALEYGHVKFQEMYGVIHISFRIVAASGGRGVSIGEGNTGVSACG